MTKIVKRLSLLSKSASEPVDNLEKKDDENNRDDEKDEDLHDEAVDGLEPEELFGPSDFDFLLKES